MIPGMFPPGARATYVNILRDLELPISIGIHPVERAAPQRVLVTVHLHCSYDATPADQIGAVVDYDFLRRDILGLAADRHFELQETLCDAIAELAMRDPRVCGVMVRSMKPDIYPDAGIGCEIIRSRS